ncbi:MAG TPA: alpha/beta hydrolase-fold protein [Conexibacter sp.]|nr:alpha/beta hydrolase-fold protein [Conexibacter sp.]
MVATRSLRARLLPLALVVASASTLAATGVVSTAKPGPSPSSACGAAAAQTGDVDLAIVSHGVRRTARVHVPRAAAGHTAAVLFAFHGTGRNGRFMERYSGLAAALDHGPAAIGVFPDADGPRWNVEERHEGADDADFASDLLAAVGARWCVDLSRVTAVGVSNGGSMAALLACTMPQRIAGVAIVAGGFATLPPCRSRRPVSVLEIHGRDDAVVPYWGSPADHRRGAVVPWLTSWIARDGCQRARPSSRAIARRTVRYDWGACRGGTEVVHIAIGGGGHQWPGASPPDPGPQPTISAATEIWDFLAALRSSP